MKHFIAIDEVPAFYQSDSLSNKVWDIVVGWEIFSKKTIGEQLVKAADSISTNIAEGFGRYFKKDKVKFYYYARGSVIEAQTWLDKSYKRKLINKDQYINLKSELEILPRRINHLIKITMEKLKD